LEADRVESKPAPQWLFDLAIWLGLVVSTFVVYAQVANFEFTIYDDGPHVYENSFVQAGLTPASIRFALTGVVLSNWMPVTMLSHIVAAELFGMQSGMHHLVNVLFHALAAGLLYAALRRATGARAPSAFVAFLFALHPLHVGSVAWISERKDVLGALFWFLGLYLYVRYTERPSGARYLLVAAAFCLGLMSKPMLVTFPFTLLLFDVWPLRRMQWPKTLWEKLPLFFLCAADAAVTYSVQGKTGALFNIPWDARVLNGFVSYVIYLRQMFWPTGLAVFYPFPLSVSLANAMFALMTLVLLSGAATLVWRTRPYLFVGWFWFVGTLVPVAGFVQVGEQAHADRYMYIPMVGLLIAIAWAGADLVARWHWTRYLVASVAVAICAACMVVAWEETAYWQNDETLFTRAIEVTGNNWLAENDLGAYMYKLQRDAEAVVHFQNAVRLVPNYVGARSNLATSLLRLEGCAAAVPQFEAVLRLNPNFAQANHILGRCQAQSGNYAAAIPLLEKAIRVEPGRIDARDFLGLSLSKIPGRMPDAIREYQEALRLSPDDATAQAALRELNVK
jgi:tetratricopeptide (TPR) repeat protein